MSKISNRFFVTAIDDGVTLHGSLTADRTLTQAWTGNTLTPDWSDTNYQPTISLTLNSGVSKVYPSGNYKWQLNGQDISFGEDGVSTGDHDGLFKRFKDGQTPKLKIISNLNSNTNTVDTNTITFIGEYNTGGNADIGFSASILTRISVMNKGGYVGVLEFENGVANITNDNDSVKINAKLYGSGENTDVTASEYTVNWFINDEQKATNVKSLTVYGSQVTDIATIRAEFKGNDNELLYTAYTYVDDLTDPEYMYIQYNGANGQSATLRKDEEVTFDIWVGKMDNPDAMSNYTDFKIKLLDSNGSVYTGNLDGIPNVPEGSDGWRPLNTGINQFKNKASITITYDIATQLGKSLTGIIMATELKMDIGGGGLTPQ